MRENTAPGDRILALGGLAILYVDSDRAPACPIVPTRFFTLSTPEYDLRGICMQAILKQPPKLIALYTARPDPTGPTMGEMVLSEFPQLREYLREHYELDREIFASVIYKRKAVPAWVPAGRAVPPRVLAHVRACCRARTSPPSLP